MNQPSRAGERYLLVVLAVRLVVSPVVPMAAPPDILVVSAVVLLITLVESVVLAVFLLQAVIAAPAARARTKSRVDFIILMLVLPP